MMRRFQPWTVRNWHLIGRLRGKQMRARCRGQGRGHIPVKHGSHFHRLADALEGRRAGIAGRILRGDRQFPKRKETK